MKAPVFWIALAMIVLVAVFIRHQFALNDELIREEAASSDLERRLPDTAWDPSWPRRPNVGQPAVSTIEECWRSMRSPIIGGMVTSTIHVLIHVLIITPVIFYLMKTRALRRGTLRASGMHL